MGSPPMGVRPTTSPSCTSYTTQNEGKVSFEEDPFMPTQTEMGAGTAAPTYITRFDGVRVLATDYRPVWLDNLADDVTIEGSAMNGVLQGPEAVRSIVS